MKMLLRLSRVSSGRLLLHMICLGRCLALKNPDRRVRAAFQWQGAKRELQLMSYGRIQNAWSSIKTAHSTLLWPRTATLRGLDNTPVRANTTAQDKDPFPRRTKGSNKRGLCVGDFPPRQFVVTAGY